MMDDKWMDLPVLAKNKGISKLYFEVAFCEIENDKHAHQMRASIAADITFILNDFGRASTKKAFIWEIKMQMMNAPRISFSKYTNPIVTRVVAINGNQK